jgi:hypothetical protein
MSFSRKALALLAGLFFSFTVHAAPVDFIDNGNSTTDSLSGLEWLDVNLTAGRNYFDVSSELGTDGEFAGWRYASVNEFLQMISNWTGISIAVQHQVVLPEGKIDGLITLLGQTSDGIFAANGPNHFIQGVLSNEIGGWHHQAAFIYDLDANANDVDFIFGNAGPYSDYSIENKYGAFLVRESQLSVVPLPPAFLLFGAAGIGLFFASRKRREA